MTSKLYDIIHLNSHMYMVDKEPSKYIGKRKTVFCTANPKDFGGLRIDCETGFCDLCRDVLASTNPSLNLPLLPDIDKATQEGKKFLSWFDKAKEEWKKSKEFIEKTGSSTTFSEEVFFMSGFSFGYKAASSKKYTEEDIKKALRQGEINEGCTACRKTDEEFIKSLNPLPIKVEVEMEDTYFDTEHQEERQREPSQIRPKTTNNIVNVVKWIYE